MGREYVGEIASVCVAVVEFEAWNIWNLEVWVSGISNFTNLGCWEFKSIENGMNLVSLGRIRSANKLMYQN